MLWKLVLLVGLIARPAAADLLAEQALCRLSIGNTIRLRAAVIVVQMGLCHRDRLLGRIDASINCSDPSTWPASNYVDGVETLARHLERVQAQSKECGVATTAEVGYTSCPAPCAALPTDTFSEVGACMECITQAVAVATMPLTLGVPPLPATKEARVCQQNISRGTVIYLNKIMKLQHNCQVLKDIAEPGFAMADCAGVHDPAHPYFTRAQRAVDKLSRQITKRCAEVMLASELDTCGGDVAAEAACVLSAADQWTTTMMQAVYPPF